MTLLNITIRFVVDNISYLSYSNSKGSFAFVFYYRIKRNKEADDELKRE